MLDRKTIALLLCTVLAVPGLALAAMSSTNYYIYADSVDYGGGTGTSTNFGLQDTFGGFATGISTSTSYQINAGYQAATQGTLSFVLSGTSISFGSLATAGTVATSNVTATVNTDSATGYTLSISGVSGTALAAVGDGIVDGAGSIEEYGLAVSGSNVAYANDAAVINGLVLSSAIAPASFDITTLTFKAVRAASSVAGTYSQNISLTAAANI